MNEAKILQFDAKAYEVACARMAADPLALTVRDFEQLDIISPGLVRDARKAQDFARQEHARLAQVKSGSAPTKPRSLTQKDLAAFAETVVAETLVLTIKKALDARVAPLEQRVKEQDARILELEAQKYAVDHVER